MLSTSFLLCRQTSLALPRSEGAGLDPPCHFGQRPGLSHKCQASLGLWTLLVWRWPAFLPQSACMACTFLHTHVYAQAFLNK